MVVDGSATPVVYDHNHGVRHWMGHTVMTSELGEQLRDVRAALGRSLKAVAEPAEISTTYLQKLEGGEVRNPSPNILHRLAATLNVPYADLMRLAGYVVPDGGTGAASPFEHALASSDLTDDERRAVAAFISHLRDQRSAGGA